MKRERKDDGYIEMLIIAILLTLVIFSWTTLKVLEKLERVESSNLINEESTSQSEIQILESVDNTAVEYNFDIDHSQFDSNVLSNSPYKDGLVYEPLSSLIISPKEVLDNTNSNNTETEIADYAIVSNDNVAVDYSQFVNENSISNDGLVYEPLSSLIISSTKIVDLDKAETEVSDSAIVLNNAVAVDYSQFVNDNLIYNDGFVYEPLSSLIIYPTETVDVDKTETTDNKEYLTDETTSFAVDTKTPVDEESSVEEDFRLLLEAEADYFADFYIEGEGDLVFEDAIYFMDLYVNGDRRGTITVEMRNQAPAISYSELKMYLSEELVPESYDRIFLGQGEYMTFEDLNAVGVNAVFYPSDYRIDLEFSLSDIPTRVISMNTPSPILGVRRSISGSNTISPAVFAIKSTYNGYLSWTLRNFDKWSYNMSLFSSNLVSLFDTYLTFNYTLRYSGEKPSFSFGSYTFYHDFTANMLRLSFGNVATGVLSPSGSAVGFRLEKSLSYQNGSYTRKSPYETTITVEKESRVEVINGERTMYDKVLAPGNYRLEDFVLYSGVNRVLVRISPVDGSTPIEIIREFSYYSSMLYPGEFYYGLSLTTGRETYTSSNSARSGAFGFSLGKKYYQYDYRNLALSADFSLGITNTLSLNGAVALSNVPTSDYIFNPKGRVNMEFTHRNKLGTTRYNLNLLEQRLSSGSYSLPSLYTRIGHQFSTGLRSLSSINLGLAYSASESLASSTGHSLNFNIGLSGRLGILGYSLGGSSYLYLSDIDLSTYSAYSSLSLSLRGGASLSASMNLSGGVDRKPNISGTLYFSYSFDSGSLSSSISESSVRTSVSTSTDIGAFNFSMYTPSFKNYEDYSKLDAYDFSTSYSTSTKYFGLGLGMSGDLSFKNLYGSASLSTSMVFADGYFVLANAIPSSALLVRQKGILKGNNISVGYSGSSSLANLKSFFGTSLYTGISTSRATEIMLYSANDDAIGSPTSASISIPPSKNRMYVYTLKADAIYTVSGIAEDLDNNLWLNGSSPLYKIEVEDDNSLTLVFDETNYVFTDDTGRFIISDIAPGMYGFDIPYNDGWILALFTLDDNEDNALKMNIYKKTGLSTAYILPEQYSTAIEYTFDVSMTSDDFWQMVFPNAFGGDV